MIMIKLHLVNVIVFLLQYSQCLIPSNAYFNKNNFRIVQLKLNMVKTPEEIPSQIPFEFNLDSEPGMNPNIEIPDEFVQESEANLLSGLVPDLMKYRKSVEKGMNSFKAGNLLESLEYFDNAALVNSTQPLAQRSFALYIAERYSDAIDQLEKDIKLIEDMKLFKATDLRLLLSACYYKLNQKENAILSLDIEKEDSNDDSLLEQRSMWKSLLSLYHDDDDSLINLMDMIGSYGENQLNSGIFYGNFYIGLYFDSINDIHMATAFLEIPRESTRFKQDDMWYHLPRLLCQYRKYLHVE